MTTDSDTTLDLPADYKTTVLLDPTHLGSRWRGNANQFAAFVSFLNDETDVDVSAEAYTGAYGTVRTSNTELDCAIADRQWQRAVDHHIARFPQAWR